MEAVAAAGGAGEGGGGGGSVHWSRGCSAEGYSRHYSSESKRREKTIIGATEPRRGEGGTAMSRLSAVLGMPPLHFLSFFSLLTQPQSMDMAWHSEEGGEDW